MASPALAAHLRYLNDSAHLLATTSPSTSAYFMSQCNSLMADTGVNVSETHRIHVCGACGHIMLVGWTCHTHLEKLSAQKTKSKRKSKTMKETDMIQTCSVCSSKTRIRVDDTFLNEPRVKKVHRRKTVQLGDASTPPNVQVPASTANASSKKRAKARKQGGLQALLAKSKEDKRSTGFGLDLLDLMKKV